MSAFGDAKRESYAIQRAASQGAGVTLVAGCAEFFAYYTCAHRIAEVLGKDGLRELADGIFESIPCYSISYANLQKHCQRLSTRHSIALVDYVLEGSRGRWCLLWKIPVQPASAEAVPPLAPVPTKPAVTMDDF